MKALFTVVLINLTPSAAGQCVVEQKMTYGGDWDFVNFIHRCPTYQFAYGAVEVVYPDKLSTFLDSGRPNVTLEYCKAKYFFYYAFEVKWKRTRNLTRRDIDLT